MKNVLESLKESVKSGKITIREAEMCIRDRFMALYGIVDIKMRMLRIPELKKIMGFPEDGSSFIREIKHIFYRLPLLLSLIHISSLIVILPLLTLSFKDSNTFFILNSFLGSIFLHSYKPLQTLFHHAVW